MVGTAAAEAVRRLGAVDRRKRTTTKNAFMAVFGWMDGRFEMRNSQDDL